MFLGGNELPARWHGAGQFVIGETGFGLGLNFLATWQAWRSSRANGRLHFISVEKHPFRRDDLAGFLAVHAELAELAGELLRRWPPLVPGFHRLHFDAGRVTLTLLFGDAQALLPHLVARVDAVYLDGFAPSKNPELWSPALLAVISRLCGERATLASWSVAGTVRRGLENLGWRLQRRPGYAAKREMLVGVRSGGAFPAPTPQPSPPSGGRHAIVIGAGLAGTAISERLANRGWRIDLLERHGGPARETSGNPSGILLPLLAKDDALAARVSRACYLYALRRYADLAELRWSPCGVLQVARDAAHEALQQATVRELGLPADFAAFVDREAAQALIGRELAHGGWWFPGGGWVSPASLCAALLAAGGDRVHARFATEVASLQQAADGWQAIDGDGKLLASAPHVILANALSANRLLPRPLPLSPIRGQISFLPNGVLEGSGPPLRQVVCRSGYITPPDAGTVCVGASFDSDETDLGLRLSDHAGNLRRLDELLPGTAQGLDPERLDGRVGLRTATPDRLPLIGALPDVHAPAGQSATLDSLPRLAGLHALLGLSARGLAWAPLVAELLASQLDGDPLPIERELVQALDPARFHLRALRRGRRSGVQNAISTADGGAFNSNSGLS